jgi:hypothetical protein
MFFGTRRESRPEGMVAVWGIAGGVITLLFGLLFTVSLLTACAALLILAGCSAHLVSAWKSVSADTPERRLLRAFVGSSSAFLVIALVTGGVAAFGEMNTITRSHLVTAEIFALAGWLGITFIGHAHRIVPVTVQRLLFIRGGHLHSDGSPIITKELLSLPVATTTLILLTWGWVCAFMGIVTAVTSLVVTGGLLISCAGVVALANLATGPFRLDMRSSTPTVPSAPAPEPHPG